MPLPDAVKSDVEGDSGSNDEDYEKSESESEEEIIIEDNSETESEPEAVEEPTRKKSKFDPLFKWPEKSSKWTMPKSFDYEIGQLSVNENELPPDVRTSRHSSPGKFYKLFVTDELIDSYLEQNLSYNEWRNINSSKRNVKEINKDEIRAVIGIILHIDVIKLPNRRMYWSSKTRVDLIASSMSINRFDEIVSVLHFNDSKNLPDRRSPLYNKCFKIQPLIDHFLEKFSRIAKFETCMSVDEQIVSFKDSHSLKSYLPKKPKKWGYKIRVMAGISGYVYDFEVEGGLGTKGPPDSCGESGFIVLRLSKDLRPRKHQLFFDNYFVSPELVDYLGNEKKLWALSALNSNRSHGCPIPTEKQMRRSGRGHIEEVVDSKKKVVIIVWHDNKRVLMLSNYIRKDPVETCKTFDREGGSKIDVERPASVKIYNTFIGCVDKAHMFLSLYRPKYQSRKWYNQVMFHLFSLAVCNSWMIYQNLGGEKCLVDFLVEICISLMHGTSSTADSEYDVRPEVYRSMRSADIPRKMCYEKFNHWPLSIPQILKYEHCNTKTKYLSTKYEVYLCSGNNRCFTAFHGVE